MLKLSNVPNEIYFTACQYENIEIEENQVEQAKEIYESEISKRHYTDEGLEKAIYDYMTLQNNFNEDDGIFADINGYIIEE